MSEVLKRRMRCAAYTRKSSKEGLDQEYNSIDAQRDAGHAYIASQRAEGWIAVADDYDDAAFSGGNMERPALKRLMADIEAGKIDVIVIYKIDRLTRSLADFSKMVEVFERQGVSFVSVTQQFNTTTSMGRLMLNVLLSFAQFEREVTGERIRDKIAASKRKGMWMGGIPPIGYDVANRRLTPNEAEAKTIAHIFQRFVELGSTTKLVKELRLDGVTSKAWTTQDGRVREGKPIDKGLIYKVLNNRTYLGELRHKELWYQAEHPPIITQSIWDDVHAILSTNGRVRATTTRAKTQYLLKGIVFGSDGRAMSPFQTAKQNGRRYRYTAHAIGLARVDAPGIHAALGAGGRSKQRRREFPDAACAAAAIEFVHCGELADRRADSLPYAFQRRVEIARALAGEPKFLLLDEPAAGMTQSEAAELGETLRTVAQQGIGVLVVDHNVPWILSLCDVVYVQHLGKMIACGTPKEVRKNPMVIAAYIGEHGTSGKHIIDSLAAAGQSNA
jgi:site-specific DNA recombinase